MAARILAAPVLLLLLAFFMQCSAQKNTLVVSADVFEKLKALFTTKTQNYISQKGEPLPTADHNERSLNRFQVKLKATDAALATQLTHSCCCMNRDMLVLL
jgi:hypothetical protein